MAKSKLLVTPAGVVTAQAIYLRHFAIIVPGHDGSTVEIGRIFKGGAEWFAGYVDAKRNYFQRGFAKRRDAAAYLVTRAVQGKLAPKPVAEIAKPEKVAKVKKAAATSDGVVEVKAKKAPKAPKVKAPKAEPIVPIDGNADVEQELMKLLAEKAPEQASVQA